VREPRVATSIEYIFAGAKSRKLGGSGRVDGKVVAKRPPQTAAATQASLRPRAEEELADRSKRDSSLRRLGPE
jgi:hypothetical protein